MANIRRNNELTKAMQAIRDMTAALMRNQRPEGNPESQGLAEFRRNKPPQSREDMIQKRLNYGLKK